MKNLLLTLLLTTALGFAKTNDLLKFDSNFNFKLNENTITLTFENNFDISSIKLINLSTNEITNFPFVNQYNSLSIDLKNYTYGGYVINIENENFIDKLMLYIDTRGLRLIDEKKIIKPIFQQNKNNILIKVLDSNSPVDISIIADNGQEIYLNSLEYEYLNNKIFSVGFDINYVNIKLKYDNQSFKKRINF
tara:strand:- start:11354 stop:11929 length:576 start_codon:yes stop_codon:yes gene_type:complete